MVMRWVVIAFLCTLSVSVTPSELRADGRFHLIFHAPDHPGEEVLRKEVIASGRFQEVVALLNSTFLLKESVTIRFGTNDGDGPSYDPENKTIIMPYGFIGETRDVLKRLADSEETAQLMAMTLDSLEFTLYHELGHALIDLFDLPVIGMEEDAVDGLATVLAIETFEHGGEIALAAADQFILTAEAEELVLEDIQGVHSLDERRYFNILCWVYGSDVKYYAGLPEDSELGPERAEGCEEEYALLADSWFRLLKPHMTPESLEDRGDQQSPAGG
ncbi:MAG: hypothetical protein HQL50_03340 [Magnetococcales bacterium]|nr:hypothetical protein [Magnetococcales bacterium]